MLRTLFLQLALCLAIFDVVVGSYRYGTLSWKHVAGEHPNTVEFELISAWKRDFKWVYVKQVEGPMGPRTLDDPPIVGDILRVTGLTFADETGMKATNPGSSAIVLKTGDGAHYFVDIEVSAYSEAEDWVMGNFTFQHVYQNPFNPHPFKPIYPSGFEYEASTGAMLNANQPFEHTPWEATFEGCCRWSEALDDNARKPYRILTRIDLTDRNNAPAARTLPVVTVPQALSSEMAHQPSFDVVAKDQFVPGRMDPTAMSGGTSMYPVDDGLEGSAQLMYHLATGADLGLDGYMPLQGVTVDSMGHVVVATNSTETGAWAAGYYQLAVVVDSASSRTVVDFMIRVVPAECQPMPVDSSEMPLTGAMAAREHVIGWVGFPVSAHIWVKDPCMPAQDMVLNYMFASLSVEASAAAPQGVVYQQAGGGGSRNACLM